MVIKFYNRLTINYGGILALMGHFLLMINWTMYSYALLLLVYKLKHGSNGPDLQQIEWVLATIPLIAFTLVYRNIKNRWAFFPWQHVKLED